MRVEHCIGPTPSNAREPAEVAVERDDRRLALGGHGRKVGVVDEVAPRAGRFGLIGDGITPCFVDSRTNALRTIQVKPIVSLPLSA